MLECGRSLTAADASTMDPTHILKPVEALQRILYIEDEPDLQWLVKHILESIGGYEVMVCGSGAEGLGALREFAPALVFLDMMMPGMDRATVLRAFRASPEGAAVPVVFLTARAEEDDEYLKLGASGVIAKPFDPFRLVEQIRTYTRGLAVA